METSAKQLAVGAGRRSSSKVCGRCKKRKTKCDSGYPSCSACERAGVACWTNNGADVPRSLVRALEEQVAALERRVEAAQQQGPGHVATALTTRLVRGTLLATEATVTGLGGIAAWPFLGGSRVPGERRASSEEEERRASEEERASEDEERTKRGQEKDKTNLGLIPLAALETMLTNYTAIHLPQCPCIQENWLRQTVTRILAADGGDTDAALSTSGIGPETGLAHFDYFAVFAVLALSSRTLAWRNAQQARIASDAFFATALQHLPRATPLTSVRRLQACLLLAHYGSVDPGRIDYGACVAAAVRIVQRGLAENDPDPEVCALAGLTRSLQHSLAATLRLPVPTSAMPTSLSAVSALESEIHRVLWLQNPLAETAAVALGGSGLGDDLRGWLGRMDEQIQSWRRVAAADPSHTASVPYDYACLRIRLYRPTPRLPVRAPADRAACVAACALLIDDCQRQARRRRLFYTWHAVHVLFEAAVVLLDACWAMRTAAVCDGKHTSAQHILSVLVPDVLALFGQLSEVWPAVDRCIDTLQPLLDTVTSALAEQELLTADSGSRSRDDAAAMATTARLHRLLFPSGPLAWNRRTSSVSSVSSIPSLAPSTASSSSSPPSLGHVDWDTYWGTIQNMLPLWDDEKPPWENKQPLWDDERPWRDDSLALDPLLY